MLFLAGCGEDGLGDPPAGSRDAGTRGEKQRERPAKRPPRIRAARCPAGSPNCAWAVGRVVYIESVDADGDGDLHVVATRVRGSAVTGGGLVVFDVNKFLRPRRDPAPGDLVTGAGPVFKGSFGQRQIEVDEFRVKRGAG